MALLTLADELLNRALGIDEDEESAATSAMTVAVDVFKMIPTLEEIDDSQREKDLVLDFIAQNQRYFLGATKADVENLPYIYGKFDDDFVFITVQALKQACNLNNLSYKKVVADLLETNFFVPDDKIEKNYKSPRPVILKRINGINTRCYRFLKI